MDTPVKSFVKAGVALLMLVVAGCSTMVPADQARPVHTSPALHTRVQQMIDNALAQVGDDYVFGVEVSPTDPDPNAWDSAELTRWSAWQVGSVIPGSSFEQYLDAKAKGLLIPVDRGLVTPGALLFHFSSEPATGGGRPAEAHVAFSLGAGRTVEALDESTGVTSGDAGDRFQYAALVEGLDY
jgi:hypothetical protein